MSMKMTGLTKEEHLELATMLALLHITMQIPAVSGTYALSTGVHRAWKKCNKALLEYRHALDEHLSQITGGECSYFCGDETRAGETVTLERARLLAQKIRLRQQREREGGPS